jgi:hypothetical protein
MGSQIRNVMPYKLVKDVRTGYETSNVDGVMNGEIDEFLKAYLMMMGQRERRIIFTSINHVYLFKLKKSSTFVFEMVRGFYFISYNPFFNTLNSHNIGFCGSNQLTIDFILFSSIATQPAVK